MKKLILAALAVFVLASPAWSQREHKQHNPEKMAQKMTDKMAEKLDLTEDQKTKVLEANTEYANAMKDSREEMKALKEAHREKLKGILTDEQFAKLDEGMKRRKKRMQEKMKERHERDSESSEEPADEM